VLHCQGCAAWQMPQTICFNHQQHSKVSLS